MNNKNQANTVLPRPVEPLPLPALSVARRKLADKLTARFGMSEEAAAALGLAVVEPNLAREAMEAPERLAVPGGLIYGVRTEVWSRFVIPDPRNPRVGPVRRYPASGLVGRDESTRLRPLPEPEAAPENRPELVQRLISQEHFAWATQQARDFVLSKNDWRASIESQGVMSAVWLVPVTFEHLDGSPSVTVPVTVEGSSRLTAVHDILNLRSADVPYDRDERRQRAHVRTLNNQIVKDPVTDDLDERYAITARCERVPALLIVGFEPHGDIAADFRVAVTSFVALQHVEPPMPWGEATEGEALADGVLDELRRCGVITEGKAAWLSGALSPDEAEVAGFSADPAIRAAAIVRAFTDNDQIARQAVRVAITTQSTRKQVRTKLLIELAVALVMRSVPEPEVRKRERIRKYLREAISVDVAREPWQATYRDTDQLTASALVEVGTGKPGMAGAELAVRAAYALIVGESLTADRGTANNDQPDRSSPGEIIERMRAVPHGVHQLHRALTDFSAGRAIRMADEAGALERLADGRYAIASDAELRRRFPRPGQGPELVPAPETPAEILGNALNALGSSVQTLEMAVKQVEAVSGPGGLPVIESLGAAKVDCDVWTAALFNMMQKLSIWGARGAQRQGPADQDVESD